MKGIPVLMYHALERSNRLAGARDSGEQLYVVQVDDFEKQLRYLKNQGFHSILVKDLLRGSRDSHLKSVILTFDDGHESNFSLALPLLQKYGFVAEFFITTGWVGQEHYLKKDQIKKLHSAGMAVGSHGVTHSFLSELSVDDLGVELEESKTFLEDIIGEPVSALSAPGGRWNTKVLDMAYQYGYSALCGSHVDLAEERKSVIPRVPMKSTTGISEFHLMIERNQIYYLKQSLRFKILSALKHVMGNHLYDKLHRKIA